MAKPAHKKSAPSATAQPYDIVIVGAGPSGLSAAVRASQQGLHYVVLEAEQAPANTVRNYQRGKLVMSEPRALPLRSALPFTASSRESVLQTWEQTMAEHQVNVRYGAKALGVQKVAAGLVVELDDGTSLQTKNAVLAMGVQGNLRKLEIPGGDLPQIQYQLDDPDAYQNETIVVIGGGDSGAENAIALSARNQVIILNRAEDFSNCKETNLNLLTEAKKTRRIGLVIGNQTAIHRSQCQR
jgi:thioredoxin reductase